MSKSNSILWTSAALGALTLSMLTAPAQAQNSTPAATQDDDVQEVVVRGFRKSLFQARELKRSSNIVSDVIVAEDMAKFPDLNLAESLQRLPGVAITREGGEGRRISLRGLGADFTRVQLNGMEVLGNVDSPMDSRGQTSRDRAFDFNIFASELFSKVEVNKSFSGEQDEGGLAGTVGLYTAKPFDYSGQRAALTLQGGTNSYTEDFQPRAAALFSKNWDNKFGVLVSVAYSKRQTEEQGYNTYGSSKFTPAQMTQLTTNNAFGTGLNISKLNAADQAKVRSSDLIFYRGNRLSVWGSDQERLGVTAAVQWRPVETLKLTLDVLHGEFENERAELHLATRANGNSTVLGAAFQGSGDNINGVTLNEIRYDSGNTVTYADVDNTVYATETRRQTTKNAFGQVILTADWNVTDRLKINAHIGRETSDYDIPVSDKFYMEAIGGLITDYTKDAYYGRNTYKWDTTNPANYRAHEIDFSATYQSTNLENAEINAAYDLSDILTLKAGWSYRNFLNKGFQQVRDDVNLTPWQTGALDDTVTPYFVLFTEHKDKSWIIADWDKALKHYNVTRSVNPPRAGTVYSVEEATDAAYVQLDWKSSFLGRPFRGNIGLRGYDTELTSKGTAQVKGVATPITAVQTYSDVLPSVNAVFEVSDTVQVRAAFSQNINRPSLGAYSVAGTVAQDTTTNTLSVNAGNPNLKPYTSNNLDLSAEWYFSTVGMLTGGFFYKEIDGFIVNRIVTNVPYGDTGLPTDLLPGLTNASNVNVYTRPVNANKGELRGIEIAAQTDFFFLPAPFDNMGVVANFTLIDSEISTFGVEGPIEGMSDINHNFTLYYETETWGARVSSNFRSDYLTNSIDPSTPATLAVSGGGFNSTTYVDTSAFYKIGPKLRLTFDAVNLTNEREEQYGQAFKRHWNTTTSGTTYFVGVNVQF